MLAAVVATATMSCPGVCPPTSTSSTPGASVSWRLKSVTRLSCLARRSKAISSGSECAAKWARAAIGEVQKAYSASVSTSWACGNWPMLPM